MSAYQRDGYLVFEATPDAQSWVETAHRVGKEVSRDPELRARWLRHGETWFVGVDALPNAPDGSLEGFALTGPWEGYVDVPEVWHKAQLSVTYPGYPQQDGAESDAAHRFRVRRCGAHVDGLHLEAGRRILREPHDFILGIALNECSACPLTVWPRSHVVIGEAIDARARTGDDVTEAYKAARQHCFDEISPVALPLRAGQSVLLHRHLLHGIAPWRAGDEMPPEGRMMAYFRPLLADMSAW